MFPQKIFTRWWAKTILGLFVFVLVAGLLGVKIPTTQAKIVSKEKSGAWLNVSGVEGIFPVDPKSDKASDNLVDTAAQTSGFGWRVSYGVWQGGVSSVSNWASASLAHGRSDVVAHADIIQAYAPRSLEFIVAASIAHQASDFKDRPFGTDAVENFWRTHVDSEMSVGIAQLRPKEVSDWAPALTGCDLMDPDNAVMVMTAKLMVADQYINQNYEGISITDRYMLLALVQNTSSKSMMEQTIDQFSRLAGRDWKTMLNSDLGVQRDWREQLRMILLQIDWLVDQGWSIPSDLNLDYWRLTAFSD